MRLGYVIANDNAEYLAGCAASDGVPLSSPDFFLWTKDPALAVIGSKRMIRGLFRLIRQPYQKPLWVLQLFETEQFLFVGTQDRNRPAWLAPSLPPSLPARKCSRAHEVRRATA